jgi:hypothetical protein
MADAYDPKGKPVVYGGVSGLANVPEAYLNATAPKFSPEKRGRTGGASRVGAGGGRRPAPRTRDPNADVSGEICKNYLAGRCRFGASCRRIHEGDIPQEDVAPRRVNRTERRDPNSDVSAEICNNYLAGKCRLAANCRRLHQGEIDQEPVSKLDEICNNFKEGKCRFGDNCRRKHE